MNGRALSVLFLPLKTCSLCRGALVAAALSITHFAGGQQVHAAVGVSDILTLREQVLSLDETHVFSPALLNVARVGYSRAGYFFTGEPTPGTPAATGAGRWSAER